MSALGQAYTELYQQAKKAAWKRGYAAGWYAAQLEQAREQRLVSEPNDCPDEVGDDG